MSKKAIKKNILITCAGGSCPIYLAKKLKRKYNIFLVDGTDNNVAPYLGLPFQKIPFGNHSSFIEEIDKLVKKWRINYIVPGADEELLPVSFYNKQNPAVIPILPAYNFIKLCLNKKKLMQKLHQSNISHLQPFRNIAEIKYPAIIKPIYGRGSREVNLVNSQKELKGYLSLYGKKVSEVLIQPYIEGDEYTVSVIVNNKNKLIGIVPKKVISKKGITRAAVVKRNNIINVVCKKIIRILNPCGPHNVQLKFKNQQVYIFEINPRLSTTSVLTDQAFGNEVELYIKYYNEKKIINPPKLKNNIFLYRYEENIFQ